jgi:CheY-like chemotaxis protein
MAVILIVDDSSVHRAALTYFQQQRGHEVEAAADGVEALERLGGWRPDVILLDLAMPNLDGLGVLAALRRSGRAPIPVVVATARADAGTLALARELGACEVLVKSEFSVSHLADVINRALAARAPADPECVRLSA